MPGSQCARSGSKKSACSSSVLITSVLILMTLGTLHEILNGGCQVSELLALETVHLFQGRQEFPAPGPSPVSSSLTRAMV